MIIAKTNKDRLIIGIDVGRDDWTSECLGRVNPGGTITILELNQWNRTIGLEAKTEPAAASLRAKAEESGNA